jgi:hypothetical protein
MITETELRVKVRVLAAEGQKVSQIALSLLSQDISDELQRSGHHIKGVDNGEKSGELFEVIREIAKTTYDNKDIIIALVGITSPIVSHLLKRREESQKKSDQNTPDSFIVVIPPTVRREIIIDRAVGDETKLLAKLLDVESDLPEPGKQPPSITVEVRTAN